MSLGKIIKSWGNFVYTFFEKENIMKKSLFVVALGFFLATGCSLAEDSVAVVDLQKVVSGSSQVKQLKQEHAKKMEELNKIKT